MKEYFELDTEVPGYPSGKSERIGEGFPPVYRSLHFVFQGWMGDEIVSSLNVFLVTEPLAQAFQALGLTGFQVDVVGLEKDPQFAELKPEVGLPMFVWLKIDGVYEESDFFLDDDALIVSKEALDLILATKPRMLMFDPFEDDEEEPNAKGSNR